MDDRARASLGTSFVFLPFLFLMLIGPSKTVEPILLSAFSLLYFPFGILIAFWSLRYRLREHLKAYFTSYILVVGAISLESYGAYLQSVTLKAVIAMVLATSLVYAIGTAFLSTIRKRESEIDGECDEGLSRRLRELLGEKYSSVPPVCLTENRNPFISGIRTTELTHKGIYLTRRIVAMLNGEELNAILLHYFHKIHSHSQIKITYSLFSIYAFEADLFVYTYILMNPKYAIIVLPIIGVLAIISLPMVILFAFIIEQHWTRKADRFAIKIAMNPEALVSAISKIEGIREPKAVSNNRIAEKFLRIFASSKEKRLLSIRKVRF